MYPGEMWLWLGKVNESLDGGLAYGLSPVGLISSFVLHFLVD